MASDPAVRECTDWLQVFKEVVTATLAIVIVGFTIYLAVRAFGMAGDATRMEDAKDLLAFMAGFAGVVVGYYFGRVPADARASQAQEQVGQAMSEKEQAMGKMGSKNRKIALLEDKARSGEQVTLDDLREVREMGSEPSGV